MEKWNKDDAIKEIKAMKRKIGLHGKKSLFISESKVALVPSKLRRLSFNISSIILGYEKISYYYIY